MSTHNTWPLERTPTQPGERRQSLGPPADPEVPRLREQRDIHRSQELTEFNSYFYQQVRYHVQKFFF